MYKNTLDEDDYKEAVRAKYEEEKEGIYSNYLSNPSQANLRDLCWKIFKSGIKSEVDLVIYNDFFKFEFDEDIENTSIGYTNSFKKLTRFFRGETEPAKIDTINFAAVLVGFEFRPYSKFKKKYTIDDRVLEEENHLITELETEVENYGATKNMNDDEKSKKTRQPINFVRTAKDKFLEKLFKKSKSTVIATLIIFCLIGGVIYFAFFKKDCMQWSENHYEVVDCTSDSESIIIPYDKSLMDFKKVKVCDTTTCFKSDGEAVIWYAKVGEGVEFFNTHGRHPENNKPLKPVTQYIIDKYVK